MAEKLKTRLVRNLLRLGAHLQREGDRLLGGHGLTQQQFVVLKEIEESGPLSQRDICSELLLEKSNVSKIVKKLEGKGFVMRSQSPEDGRVDVLEVTRAARNVVKECMGILNEWNRQWLGPLSEGELESAALLTEKLTRIR